MSELHVHYLNRLPKTVTTVVQEARDLPVVFQADVVVVGGGVAGVAAALGAAAEGRSVAVVEERNHFGFELSGPHKITTAPYRLESEYQISERICRSLAELGGYNDGYINPDALMGDLHRRIAREDRVRPFLYTLGTGVLIEGETVRGVVILNRSGRQVVLASVVIDATEDGHLAAAVGAPFVRSWAGEKTCRRFVRLWKNSGLSPGPLSVPPALNAVDDAVTIHQMANKTYVEYVFTAQVGERPAWDLSRLQAVSLDNALDLVHFLEEATGQESVSPSTTSKAMDRYYVAQEIFVDESPVVACRSQLTGEAVKSFRFDDQRMRCIEGVEGLMLAGRNLSTDPGIADLQALLCSGEAAGRAAASFAQRAEVQAVSKSGEARSSLSERFQIRELLDGPETSETYSLIREPEAHLPVGDEVDVLVAGGGTSGAVAAIAAAEEGARVVVVDTLGGLGGTATHLVTTYYWGATYCSTLSQKIDDVIPTYWREVGKQSFSGQEKMRVLEKMAVEAGVKLIYRTMVAGVVMEGRTIVGVVLENIEGRQVVRTKMVIDATGHGDVAAAAGAEFTKGRETDGFMMEMNMPGKGLRDPTNADDITTFLMKKPTANKSFPLRESRIVQGDYRLTFQDILAGQHFPDAVAGWRSNYDTHFPHSANQSDIAQDWMAILGLFRKPLEGTVPYRCLLPRGVENLLVVGKAFSTDHDAKIAVRMQRDLQHLGEAAGVAAALAVQRGLTAREVPIGDLQQRLLERRILLPQHLKEETDREAALDAAVKKLGTSDALEAMIDLYRAGAQSVSFVRPFLESNNSDVQMQAAVLLGMLGDRAAIPVLMESLIHKDDRIFVYIVEGASKKDSVPLYYSAAILLGRFREKAAVPHMVDILKDHETCPFDLASFVITALGRIGDCSAVEVIQPFLHKGGVSADVVDENLAFEQKWGVRTNAAKALAELGDLSGVPFLIELLLDDQAQVRDYARKLLQQMTGETLGNDVTAWRRWWEFRAEHFSAGSGGKS